MRLRRRHYYSAADAIRLIHAADIFIAIFIDGFRCQIIFDITFISLIATPCQRVARRGADAAPPSDAIISRLR